MELSVRIERWPLAGAFTISRGSETEAVVVATELNDGAHRGRGECVPYARYGETPDRIVAAIEAMRPALGRGLGRTDLQGAMPACAARNALDCAYRDVNAEAAYRRNHELAGLVAPEPRVTASTISLAAPAAMAEAAERAELIVDANEGWTDDNLQRSLDGPLLLAKDRPDGLRYDGSIVYPAGAALWG